MDEFEAPLHAIEKRGEIAIEAVDIGPEVELVQHNLPHGCLVREGWDNLIQTIWIQEHDESGGAPDDRTCLNHGLEIFPCIDLDHEPILDKRGFGPNNLLIERRGGDDTFINTIPAVQDLAKNRIIGTFLRILVVLIEEQVECTPRTGLEYKFVLCWENIVSVAAAVIQFIETDRE